MKQTKIPILEKAATICGGLSAISLALIGLIITAQILARTFGYLIPAADDFAIWAMVSSMFLGLPYAFIKGDHIRITVLLQALSAKPKKIYELQATIISVLLGVWASYYSAVFVYESYLFNEISQGMLSVPLWIPQLPIPIGLILLTALLIERVFRLIRGTQLEVTHE